jgi:hypothetical protein
MDAALQHTAATITERSKTLINNDLKKILKEEGKPQTGNKAALQARVIDRTYMAAAPRPPLALLTFTFTSHCRCRRQERPRAIAPPAPSRAAPRRSASLARRQSYRASILATTPAPCKRLHHVQRLPVQWRPPAAPAPPALNALAYVAHVALHRPAAVILTIKSRTHVFFQRQPILRDTRARAEQHVARRYACTLATGLPSALTNGQLHPHTEPRSPRTLP